MFFYSIDLNVILLQINTCLMTFNDISAFTSPYNYSQLPYLQYF